MFKLFDTNKASKFYEKTVEGHSMKSFLGDNFLILLMVASTRFLIFNLYYCIGSFTVAFPLCLQEDALIVPQITLGFIIVVSTVGINSSLIVLI